MFWSVPTNNVLVCPGWYCCIDSQYTGTYRWFEEKEEGEEEGAVKEEEEGEEPIEEKEEGGRERGRDEKEASSPLIKFQSLI